MEDLKTILAGRAAFYSKADPRVDTSGQPLLETFQILRAEVRQALGLPVLEFAACDLASAVVRLESTLSGSSAVGGSVDETLALHRTIMPLSGGIPCLDAPECTTIKS